MSRSNERPRPIDQPKVGYFRIRLVRKGMFVAARISNEFGFWRAMINGQSCGAADPDPAKADGVYRIWTTGVQITKQEYDRLLGSPPSSPQLPIDIGSMPPPRF